MPEPPPAILVPWESVPPTLERWVWSCLFPEEEIEAQEDGVTCLIPRLIPKSALYVNPPAGRAG